MFFGISVAMRFFYLYLASMLIHPCPYCWAGQAVSYCIHGPVVSGARCVEDCSCPSGAHSHDSHQHENHDDKQKCPCQCHAEKTIYVQLVPSIDLKVVGADLIVAVDESRCIFENITIATNGTDPTSMLLTVSLRI